MSAVYLLSAVCLLFSNKPLRHFQCWNCSKQRNFTLSPVLLSAAGHRENFPLVSTKIFIEFGHRADRSDYVAFEDNVVYNNTWWSSSASSGMTFGRVVTFATVTWKFTQKKRNIPQFNSIGRETSRQSWIPNHSFGYRRRPERRRDGPDQDVSQPQRGLWEPELYPVLQGGPTGFSPYVYHIMPWKTSLVRTAKPDTGPYW